MYFFDLDGTLLDSNGVWLDIDIEFLGRQGIHPVPEDYTEFVTHNSFSASAIYTKERFGLSRVKKQHRAESQDKDLSSSGQGLWQHVSLFNFMLEMVEEFSGCSGVVGGILDVDCAKKLTIKRKSCFNMMHLVGFRSQFPGRENQLFGPLETPRVILSFLCT